MQVLAAAISACHNAPRTDQSLSMGSTKNRNSTSRVVLWVKPFWVSYHNDGLE